MRFFFGSHAVTVSEMHLRLAAVTQLGIQQGLQEEEEEEEEEIC
jgi:hypothetical protein